MRVHVVAVAAFVLAVLCLPAGAGAKPGHRPQPNRLLTRIELRGSNGYSILIVSNPKQHLTVLTTKEEGDLTYTNEYLTRDTFDGPDGVRAALPGLGKISVRFHPREPVRHPSPSGCQGPHPSVQRGAVRGEIKFVGEGEYTRVETHEAKAVVEGPTVWFCDYGAPDDRRSREEWTSKLLAAGDGTYFLARRYQPGVLGKSAQALYLAERGEAFETALGRASFTVWRRATVTAAASTFNDVHPEHTTISPPPPFTGSAVFARTPESVFTWTGDLSVQLPGVDSLPLAGPDFEPDYCLREAGCIHQQVRFPFGP